MTDKAELTESVTLPSTEQAIVYFPGDGMPLIIGDNMSAADLQGYLPGPIARAVFAARLRAIAAMLDDPFAEFVAQASQSATS